MPETIKVLQLKTTRDDKELFNILSEELTDKKRFNAMYDTECNGCYNHIFEGDTFIFMGNKQKICEECVGRLESICEDVTDLWLRD